MASAEDFEGRDRLKFLREQGELLHGAENTEESRAALWGLARELLKIRNRAGKHVPLEPNEVQRAFEVARGQRNIVLKARQVGISTWASGRLFLKTITMPGTLTVQVAHTQEAAESLFRMVHRFWEQLPKELREGGLRTSRSSVRQMVFPELDSEYRVLSAGNSGAGRGLTINNLHCSEVARWPGDAEETLNGLRAAMPPNGELILESTPMGAGGCFWREWQEAPATGTVRHFFPWWMESAYVGAAVDEEELTEDECGLMREHGLTHAQIGFRRQIQANYRGLTKQEYAEDAAGCFLSSGDCVFAREAMDRCSAQMREIVDTRLGGQLIQWLPAQPGREYLVAVDPAGGGAEGDYSAIEVIDREHGWQCAELRARLGPAELARETEKLAREYNEALVVVERNNHGHAVLVHLELLCHYTKLYEQDGQTGWYTTSLSRPRAIGMLNAALEESPDLFSSERLLRECRTFVRYRNGKEAAQGGEHDDLVMAMAMGLAVRAELESKRLAVR